MILIGKGRDTKTKNNFESQLLMQWCNVVELSQLSGMLLDKRPFLLDNEKQHFNHHINVLFNFKAAWSKHHDEFVLREVTNNKRPVLLSYHIVLKCNRKPSPSKRQCQLILMLLKLWNPTSKMACGINDLSPSCNS